MAHVTSRMLTVTQGSPFANYDIGWSSPDFVGPGCAFEKLIISGGPGFLSAAAEFSFGSKDRSPLIKRDTAYFDTLNSLSSSYVVLYDVQDRRAWLSNGLHTLLHLVRASLQRDRDSELAAECLFDQSKLQEEADVHSPRAAINFLRNRHNLEQLIFPDLEDIRTEQATTAGQTSKTEYRTSTGVLLKDRINQIIYVLEQLIDFQSGADTRPAGIPLKLTPRSKLEGYRFMDIAARRPVTPRVVNLGVSNGYSKSWVDFTRAIKAVTLFGEGFGELISPVPHDVGTPKTCPGWETLPRSRDYLAVSAYDLSRIIRQEGSMTSVPLKLAPGVYWHTASALEAFTCTCNAASMQGAVQGRNAKDAAIPTSHRHPFAQLRLCDPVQVLLPDNKLIRRVSRTSCPPGGIASTSHSSGEGRGRGNLLFRHLGNDCAVIFGRSELFPWHWPDRGNPKPGHTTPAEREMSSEPTGLKTGEIYRGGVALPSSALSDPEQLSSTSSSASASTPSTVLTPTQSLSEDYNSAGTSQVAPSLLHAEERESQVPRKVWRAFRSSFIEAVQRR